ncbi:sensor histidine kinase [Streptomyces sp. SID3343]|uniref:sensor histidine kinase n=1 Tax=Streptomyces sp. SID3343 TaxID=2690260 RepID=UPI00136A3DA1|nr:sensor histidine kinase [Streptomyces sp. SID3343]MYV98016.1 sensor histidine kinase [Streptomyces sp. SID3343]
MPTHRASSVASGPTAGPKDVLAPLRTTSDAFEHLVGGLGTAVLALVALVWTIAVTLACLVGVGLLLVPGTLRLLRAVADRERARLSGWGEEITRPSPGPDNIRAALADPTTRRELRWLVVHATLGLLVGLAGVTLPLSAATDILFPVWWRLVPPSKASPSPADFGPVGSWPGAFAVCLAGVGLLAVAVATTSWTARLQAWPGRRLLPPRSSTDLSLRVAQLTATRAAALDAHAVELRRIERSLHDGTQNRLVAVGILIGAARRTLSRDPSRADDVLERAQSAAEQALAELRTVVRSILPPVLADRSLADALTGLAAACPVSCRIDADDIERHAASVEATAYFVVAEALTNIARHSAARSAAVTLRRRDDRLCLTITDDGCGGADEQGGSGLTGIRRRAEAHDGTFTLDSPSGGPTTMEVSLPCGW